MSFIHISKLRYSAWLATVLISAAACSAETGNSIETVYQTCLLIVCGPILVFFIIGQQRKQTKKRRRLAAEESARQAQNALNHQMSSFLDSYLSHLPDSEKDALMTFMRVLNDLEERLEKYPAVPERWKQVLSNISIDVTAETNLPQESVEVRVAIANAEKQLKKLLDDVPMLTGLIQRNGLDVDELNVIRGIIWYVPRFWEEHALPKLQRWKEEHGDNLSDPLEIARWYKETHDSHMPLSDSLHLLLQQVYETQVTHKDVKDLIVNVDREIELDNFEQRVLGTAGSETIRDVLGDYEHLDGYEFEAYLAKLFGRLGWNVVHTGQSGDQGADLVVIRNGEKFVVQAKKYSSPISNGAVQEAIAAISHYGADGAMVVTNSTYTDGAIRLAFSNDVELWDGRKLDSMLAKRPRTE